jgi:hypothetical protein
MSKIWDEDMLENHSYWDIDILEEYREKKKNEIKGLSTSFWNRIWNWRKIKKLKKELDEIHYII